MFPFFVSFPIPIFRSRGSATCLPTQAGTIHKLDNLETQPENNTCYYLLLNPDGASMDFMVNQKAKAAAAGIPEKYTQTSKPHITLVSWEDKPEADEWMVCGISAVVERYSSFHLHVGEASVVGPQWGKHLIVEVGISNALADFMADLKKELKGRKGKLHLTLAYKVPGDKIPESLVPENFDVDSELVFDSFTLLKYTAQRKYVNLGNFGLSNEE